MTAIKWLVIIASSFHCISPGAYAVEESYSAGVVDAVTGETYLPIASDDSDFNGIPDNPFISLPGVGQVWLATVWNEDFTKVKTVVAERWNGATRNNEPTFIIDVDVQRSDDTLQRIVLEVPYALARRGESAAVLVAVASDLETLLGPTEAEQIAQLPNGFIVLGAQFIEVSVIVSEDGGATFSELDETRLSDHPIRLIMDGLMLDTESIPGFFKHSTFVASDGVGLTIVTERGKWQAVSSMTFGHERITDMDQLQAAYTEASLRSLSVFIPFVATPPTDTGANASGAGGSSASSDSETSTGDPQSTSATTASGTRGGSTGGTSEGGGTAEGLGGPVWVDFDYLGVEDGSEAQPFNLFAEGIFVVPASGVINLKPGVSDETDTTSKAMTITSVGGTARIGDASAIRDVTINEFVPTNLDGLQDEDSSAQDWIELFNAGTSAVSLNGWGLSNDSANPFKWAFPNVSIPAGSYLVVFASAKNRTPTGGNNLHTNFTLAASADDIVLTTAGASPISTTKLVNYPSVRDDNAFAYFPVGSGGLFEETNSPTPGTENEESGPIVILDPGHGVGSAGNSATTGLSNSGTQGIDTETPEYLATYLVAEQVKSRIEQLDSSIEVIITKASSTINISNLDRARQLGDYNADVLVSLHFDGFSHDPDEDPDGAGPRRTLAIALPIQFEEVIGGVTFRTDNRNQPAEIAFAQSLVSSVVGSLTVLPNNPPVNGGIRSTGTDANKGVLFETSPGWSTNPPWEERLYHANPDTPASERGLAVLLEIDNFRNEAFDNWFNNPNNHTPFPFRYEDVSNAIAQTIIDQVNE